MATRKELIGVLELLGVTPAGDMSTERIQARIVRLAEKKGIPAGATKEQKAIIESLGLSEAPKSSGELESEAAGDDPKPAKKGKKPADKGDKGEKGERKGRGGMQAFKDIWAKKNSVKESDLLSALAEVGVTQSTTRAYISWAKRVPKKFGFGLEKTKDKEGNVIFRKVAG